MNIVIKNQNSKITDSLNLDIIKTLSGEFSLDEIKNELINFYYKKIIIDITAINNHYDINSVLEFLKEFNGDTVVLLLNDSEVINSNSYLGILVENGYYNFTRNGAGVNYLLNNPNGYDDVKSYCSELSTTKKTQPFETRPDYVKSKEPKELKKEKEKKSEKYKTNYNQKIIGIQNLTDHAGATTLSYMMIKHLKLNYNVKGIEMNKQDFVHFRDSDLALCTSIDDLKLKLREFAKVDAIIIDLNDFDGSEICDEILYLLDPGTLKLNKLLKKDMNIRSKVKDGKVILNRSSIKHDELPTFEYETKFKVYFNIDNFNDRADRIRIVDMLLYNLGFKKQNFNLKGVFGSLLTKK